MPSLLMLRGLKLLCQVCSFDLACWFFQEGGGGETKHKALHGTGQLAVQNERENVFS